MDIIFFAALAIFIFIKLKSQFGRVDEDQKREAIKKFLKEQAARTTSMQKQDDQNNKLNDQNLIKKGNDDLKSQEEDLLKNVDSGLRTKLTDILNQSNTSITKFNVGANAAFEMVLEYFAQGHKDGLKSLLAKDLFDKFSQAIDTRVNDGNKLTTNIVAIDQSTITDARLDNNKAIIMINFVSQQISYLSNQEGNLIEGSKQDINQVSDIWTFERSINSKNPNWTITKTGS